MTYGASDVSVWFGDTVALQDVTVAVEPGAVTAVVGGDGAGKTTLLRAVVGRVAPETGSVAAPPAENIGYQPASGGTWPDLTVEQNLQFVGGTYGMSGQRLERRIDALLGRAGLVQARDRLSRDLSGGMRTKLGFCAAIVHEPELLVLDEPSTGVDPVSRVELWRMLSEAAASGTAVLFATTYLDEAERANDVLLLERGTVLLAGPPADVVAASPGVVASTGAAVRPDYSWRYGHGFREWWPDRAPEGQSPVEVDLEDVAIVAALRSHHPEGAA